MTDIEHGKRAMEEYRKLVAEGRPGDAARYLSDNSASVDKYVAKVESDLEEQRKQNTENIEKRNKAEKRAQMAPMLGRHGFYSKDKFWDDVASRIMVTSLSNLDGEEQLHCSFILFDLDHFKQINEVHGHQMGDLALLKVAEIISKNIRTDRPLPLPDEGFRYGGEELGVLAYATQDQAYEIAERIREKVKSEDWKKLGLMQPVTLSAGVDTYPYSAIDEFKMYRKEKLYFTNFFAQHPEYEGVSAALKETESQITEKTIERMLRSPILCRYLVDKVKAHLKEEPNYFAFESEISPHMLVYRTDMALMHAKKTGRDRTAVYRQLEEVGTAV